MVNKTCAEVQTIISDQTIKPNAKSKEITGDVNKGEERVTVNIINLDD